MAHSQKLGQVFGNMILKDFLNPPDQMREEKFRKSGRLAQFEIKGEEDQPLYMTEKSILHCLAYLERMAEKGVRNGRTLNELFNAVDVGFPVNAKMRESHFKFQDYYMLLDGMYGGEVRPIKPYSPSPAKDLG